MNLPDTFQCFILDFCARKDSVCSDAPKRTSTPLPHENGQQRPCRGRHAKDTIALPVPQHIQVDELPKTQSPGTPAPTLPWSPLCLPTSLPHFRRTSEPFPVAQAPTSPAHSLQRLPQPSYLPGPRALVLCLSGFPQALSEPASVHGSESPWKERERWSFRLSQAPGPRTGISNDRQGSGWASGARANPDPCWLSASCSEVGEVLPHGCVLPRAGRGRPHPFQPFHMC